MNVISGKEFIKAILSSSLNLRFYNSLLKLRWREQAYLLEPLPLGLTLSNPCGDVGACGILFLLSSTSAQNLQIIQPILISAFIECKISF